MSITLRTPFNTPTAIQQFVNSAHFFDGTLPAGDSPLTNYSVYKYAAQNAGGLFYWNVNEAIVVSQFNIDLGAPGDINIYLADLDPASVKAGAPVVTDKILIEQASAQRFLALDESKFKTVLLPYQALQLITTASAAAQVAQAIGALERTYVR